MTIFDDEGQPEWDSTDYSRDYVWLGLSRSLLSAGEHVTSTSPGDAPTYELMTVVGCPAIRCRLCGSVSCAPGDITHRWCGRCHIGHDIVAAGRQLHADRGVHQCRNWRTALGECAICGKPVRP